MKKNEILQNYTGDFEMIGNMIIYEKEQILGLTIMILKITLTRSICLGWYDSEDVFLQAGCIG